LRGAVGTRGDRKNNVFVHGHRPAAGAALAHAIEVRVVVLARKIVPRLAIANREILPAKECGRIRVGVPCQSVRDAGQRARRRLFVEHAVRVHHHCAERGVQRFVGLDVVDGGISRERPKQRLQTRARGHVAVAEYEVLAIGRDAVRQIRRRHVRHQTAENLDGCVE